MAMDCKQLFLRDLEERLADQVTVADMAKVLSAAADLLSGFGMRTAFGREDGEDDCIKCYLDALSVECRSQKTIDRYKYVLGRLMGYVKVPTRKITVYHLRSHLQAEKERGLADRTLEGYRSVYSAFFNWLQRESLIDRNPTANLGCIKCSKREKVVYSAVEIEKLNAATAETQEPTRNRAIIHFLLSTGCRISEMTSLDRGSVNLAALECVVRGKGDKERVVYLSEVAGMLLGEYLKSRTDDDTALFHGLRGRLQPNGVRMILKTLAEKAGLEHVHPHKFRRTLATDLSRRGMPVQEVAKILGHEKIDTTMEYVVLNRDEIKTSYRRHAG